MRNRRDRRYNNSAVVHLTIRTVEGLPFICRPYMNKILLGIMARGQGLYPINLVAFLWMGNHPHMIVAGRVNLLSRFTNYLDGEVANATKRLFPGIYSSKVWHDRVHEQPLLTSDAVVEKIAYLYANPARAHLVDTIDEYPGLSSWKMFAEGSHVVETDWIPRRHLISIKKGLSNIEELELLTRWKKRSPSKEQLVIKPYEWKRFFPDTCSLSNEAIYQKIVLRVRDYEAEARSLRKKPVLGEERLKSQCPYRKHVPRTKTPTPPALSTERAVKKAYMDDFKEFCYRLKLFTQKLLRGQLSKPLSPALLPPGGYLPGGVLTALLVFS